MGRELAVSVVPPKLPEEFPGHFDPFNAGKTLRFAHSSEEAPTISTGIFQPRNPSLADAVYVVNLVIAFGILVRIIIIRKG